MPSCHLPMMKREHLNCLLVLLPLRKAPNTTKVKVLLVDSIQKITFFVKRIFTQDDQLPTFMALYGSQHQLDQQLLEQHGFFRYFLALNFRKTGAPCLYKTLWPGKKAKVKSKVETLRKKVKVKGKVKFLRLFCFCWCCDSINKNKMI